ncbi:metal ABC transporter permease [Candidatus Venteria ishoeyi]|uniref:metal ABC transporter permease n=1 Tax=Candidatus Venteria ishoeyi TaxID=1899563 RepID=UPI0025A64CDC|nr:metal ABC transporter permease [Candidatus Venteria ishoeyi]MDM8545702.1 metal ABC transporter permease [Candidatus Venteria ishoeyi]
MDGLDVSILGPAFIAGLLVLITHVPLGQEVLKRGIIFIDLAIAQIAGLGVIAASRLGFETHGWEVQIIAIGSALLGAWGLSLLEKHQAKIQEALIGVFFILAATGSILLLADNPHGGEQLKALLVGQILWLTWAQLMPLALITGLIALLWFLFQHNRRIVFYLVFAVAVTSSVQLVGVYLVFASLIIPALGSRGIRKSLIVGYGIGALGYGLGLILSSVLDLPSGAVIVWMIAIIALLPGFFIKYTTKGTLPFS